MKGISFCLVPLNTIRSVRRLTAVWLYDLARAHALVTWL